MGYAVSEQRSSDDTIFTSWVKWTIDLLIVITILSIIKLYPFFSGDISKWEDDWNVIELITAGTHAFWSISFNFLICELGERITSKYEGFGEELLACEWYLLPTEVQRIYLIFLLDTQKPVHVRTYGNILYARDTCKKVILIAIPFFSIISWSYPIHQICFFFYSHFQTSSTGFSYFMALRKMR